MGASSGQDLVGFVSAMGGERALRVEENLGEGYVRLRVSEAERRQAKQDVRCVEDVVTEMLRNARDAGAMHVYVATGREGDLRTTTVLDDGCGIPEDMHARVFEARVTSKLESVHMDRWGIHGRGMALFSIRVVTNASELSERADQSSWPSVGADEEGAQSCVRGPHNIIRACCEFALEERGACEVFLGSPAEVAATARARAARSVDGSELLFLDSLSELPVLERMRAAADARDLREEASRLGLEMSERTAHRIVSGQIRPLRSVLSRLLRRSDDQAARPEIDLARDRRGLRISADDAAEFSRVMERDFSLLAERYYLTLASEPKVCVSPRRLTVIFELGGSD